MKRNDLILIGAVALASYFLISRTKIGSSLQTSIGETIGSTTGAVIVGAGQSATNTVGGFFSGLWDYGYNVGRNSYFLSPQYFKDIWANTYAKLF